MEKGGGLFHPHSFSNLSSQRFRNFFCPMVGNRFGKLPVFQVKVVAAFRMAELPSRCQDFTVKFFIFHNALVIGSTPQR